MIEWNAVRKQAMEVIESSSRALETCEHDRIEFYRGRISAMRIILKLDETARRLEAAPMSLID